MLPDNVSRSNRNVAREIQTVMGGLNSEAICSSYISTTLVAALLGSLILSKILRFLTKDFC